LAPRIMISASALRQLASAISNIFSDGASLVRCRLLGE
jgi:hypothetical protein